MTTDEHMTIYMLKDPAEQLKIVSRLHIKQHRDLVERMMRYSRPPKLQGC